MLWGLYNRKRDILSIKWFQIRVDGLTNREKIENFKLDLCVVHFITVREVNVIF